MTFVGVQMAFSIIWHAEVIPSDWKKRILLPVIKRQGSETDWSNYHGITLLSVPGILFAMLQLKHATSFLHALCLPQQTGFMPGRPTTEPTYTVRQVVEKSVEFIKKAYIAFIDFRSAFETLDRPSLWLILKAADLPAKIISLFKELYSSTENSVPVNGKLSSSFPIQNGVRQGCATAPELFNYVIGHILNETQYTHPFVISYAQGSLSDVAFADDVAVLSDYLHQLKSALETLSSTASRVGLQINWKKTKIMPIENTVSAPLSTVEINGQACEVVRQFTYLGSIISSSGILDGEISARSARVSSVFGQLLRAVIHKPQISRHTKARTYNTTVSSIILYSSKTWLITQTQLGRVDAVQPRHLRRVEGFKWYYKIRYMKILKPSSWRASLPK